MLALMSKRRRRIRPSAPDHQLRIEVDVLQLGIIADAAFQGGVNAPGVVFRSNGLGIIDRLVHDQRKFMVSFDDAFGCGAFFGIAAIDERETFAVAGRLWCVSFLDSSFL